MFEDKLLTCKDCGKDFIFSVHEQEFFADSQRFAGDKASENADPIADMDYIVAFLQVENAGDWKPFAESPLRDFQPTDAEELQIGHEG